MTFLLARIEHAARAFLRGGDLDRRVTRSAVEHEAFDDEFPDGPYIPGFDYTPGPGAMQDMGANCAAAAEMFPQYTKTSVARPPGAADGPEPTSPPNGSGPHTLPAAAGSQRGTTPGGGETPTSPAAGHSTSDLLTAASTQLAVWLDLIDFSTHDRERSAYLHELIPELQARAAELHRIEM